DIRWILLRGRHNVLTGRPRESLGNQADSVRRAVDEGYFVAICVDQARSLIPHSFETQFSGRPTNDPVALLLVSPLSQHIRRSTGQRRDGRMIEIRPSPSHAKLSCTQGIPIDAHRSAQAPNAPLTYRGRLNVLRTSPRRRRPRARARWSPD